MDAASDALFTLAARPAAWAALLAFTALKGAVVLGAAALGAALLRRAPAAARHLVWTAALMAALALPALAALAPDWTLAVLPAAGATASAGPRALSGAWSPPGLSPTGWALALWLLGALAVAVRGVAGALSARALVRRAAPLSDPAWRGDAEAVGRALGLRRAVDLRASPSLRSPVAWGVRRPVLLLPPSATTWTVERRAAVLAHELAHVRRADCLTQALAQAACALHWFNPLAWWAYRRLLVERERACDDSVLRGGLRPSSYAAHLLAVAREGGPPRAARAALPLARRTEIEERIRALLDVGASRHRLTRRGAAGLLAVACALVGPLGTIELVREEAPQPPAPAPRRASEIAVATSPSRPQAVTPLPPARPPQPARPEADLGAPAPARAGADGAVARATPASAMEGAVVVRPTVVPLFRGKSHEAAVITAFGLHEPAGSGPQEGEPPAVRGTRVALGPPAHRAPRPGAPRPRIAGEAGVWEERVDDAWAALDAPAARLARSLSILERRAAVWGSLAWERESGGLHTCGDTAATTLHNTAEGVREDCGVPVDIEGWRAYRPARDEPARRGT